MAVHKLVQERWEGRQAKELVKESPAWQDVQLAVAALDADQFTLVVVEGWGATEILIGGGGGKYVVSVAKSPDDLFTLVNSSGPSGNTVLLKAGGQTGNYPAEEVVNFKRAIQAARWFCEHNEPDPSLVWKTN
jgi:hypothetical protein